MGDDALNELSFKDIKCRGGEIGRRTGLDSVNKRDHPLSASEEILKVESFKFGELFQVMLMTTPSQAARFFAEGVETRRKTPDGMKIHKAKA